MLVSRKKSLIQQKRTIQYRSLIYIYSLKSRSQIYIATRILSLFLQHDPFPFPQYTILLSHIIKQMPSMVRWIVLSKSTEALCEEILRFRAAYSRNIRVRNMGLRLLDLLQILESYSQAFLCHDTFLFPQYTHWSCYHIIIQMANILQASVIGKSE